jgi:hypothetical protein
MKDGPKRSDIVFLADSWFVRYIVVSVDPDRQTADIKTTTPPMVTLRDIPWSKLVKEVN